MTISPDFRPRLIIMVKAPVAGRVKTRLGRDIGMTTAAWWFRHQVQRTIRNLTDRRWQTVLAVSPDGTHLPASNLPRIDQGNGDLGARMTRIFHIKSRGPVVIVGADIPGVTKNHISRAFAALGAHDAVFGPATDGGFWLVGMKRVRPLPCDLFQGVRWSTEHALADSLATIADLRVAMTVTLSDVDL